MLAVLHVRTSGSPTARPRPAGLRHHRPRAPRRRPTCSTGRNPWYVGRAPSRASSCPSTTTSPSCAARPRQVREEFARLGWTEVVAFQTRNPMHRAHVELTMRAAAEVGANLLIQPVVGMTKPGDVDHYTRVRGYQAVLLATTPQSPPPCRCCRWRCGWAGPARRCGTPSSARTTAAPTSSSAATTPARVATPPARPFYGPYDAQDLLRKHEEELGVQMVDFQMMVYLPDEDRYVPEDEVPEGAHTLSISGTELRQRLAEGPGDPGVVHLPRGGHASCAGPTPRARSRGSRSSSPGSPARASRPSPTPCWSSCWRWAAAR